MNIKTDMQEALRMIRSVEDSTQLRFKDLRQLYPYIKKHLGKFIGANLLMVMITLLALPGPYLMMYLVDDVFVAKNLEVLHAVILILLGIQLLRFIISLCMNYMFTRLNQSILVEMKKDMFHKIMKLPLSFFEKNQTGYLMSRINEVSGLGFFFSQPVIQLFTGVLEFVFCLAMLFYIHPTLTLLSLLVLPLLYMAAKYYVKGVRGASKDILEKSAHISKEIQESLSGIGVVKAFASEERESKKIEKSLTKFLNSAIIRGIIQTMSAEVLLLITTVASFLVLWYSGTQIINETFTIGGYIAFSGYLMKMFMPAQSLANLGLILQPVAVALNRVSEILNEVGEDEDQTRTIAVSNLKGRLAFEDVSFAYNNQDDLLHHVSFKVQPGEKVAIVGPSGSGKSTILKLMLGLYKPEQGTVAWDGIDMNTLMLPQLRERIGWVSQNIFLFNDTIKNNILYSNPSATDREVIRAAELADAHDFITKMPKGYDTVVGERGMTLSGGQMQRISIARAILKRPDVIIFDEATSHLDSESERCIRRTVQETFQEQTCIIVAHRLSTIAGMERIYVIDDGRIVESGEHEALIQSNGRYSELYGTDVGVDTA